MRNSKIIICKDIKLDKEYNNVLNYSESNMLALCQNSSHLVESSTNYSFIRNRGTISVNFSYSDCLKCNYMAFQNPDYDNKWFFAFIDDVHYVADGTTEIEYTIDCWSTWFDNWTAGDCFVVREHVNDDTIGLNTIPENLNVGDVYEEQETVYANYSNQAGYYVMVSSSYQIADNSTGDEVLPSNRGSQYSSITVYNNNIFGKPLAVFDIMTQNNLLNLAFYLLRTNYDGHIADIDNIYILPKLAVSSQSLTSHTASVGNQSFTWYTMPTSMSATTFTSTITKRTSFTGYTPKNNKCFVYPYNYLLVSNNQGSQNIYKYEDFTTASCVFENEFCISIGGSGRLVPKDYKNMGYNEDEALPLGKYPTCAWSSDAYTNWLTQNAVNIPTSLVMGGASNAQTYYNAKASEAGVTAGTLQSIGLSIAGNIANTIGSFYTASLLPNISGGQATGDIAWSADKNGFTFREMRAKTEYLKVIDEYFTRYGYKVNRVKTPNITGRTYWNYIEIDAHDDIGFRKCTK